MWSQRLTWAFAGLFILFGLPLLIAGDRADRYVWGGLSTLSLGGFAFALAYNAVATGVITLQYSTISRGAQPRTFWAAVGLAVAAGCIVVVGGFSLLFFAR